jgi:hypothetical protein
MGINEYKYEMPDGITLNGFYQNTWPTYTWYPYSYPLVDNRGKAFSIASKLFRDGKINLNGIDKSLQEDGINKFLELVESIEKSL